MFAALLKKWRGVTGRGRRARGERLSQPEAAARLGVPLRTYQNWEIGRFEPQGFARSYIEQKITADKNAGRPSAVSNRNEKRTRLQAGTGKNMSNNETKKIKAK